MKNFICLFLLCSTLVSCGVFREEFRTPPLYFPANHYLPVTDSTNKTAVGIGFQLPFSLNGYAERRIGNRLTVHGFYNSTFGISVRNYETFPNNKFGGGGAAFDFPVNPYNKIILSAQYMGGNVQNHYDGTPEYQYTGVYESLSFTPIFEGIVSRRQKDVWASVSLKNSWINFKEYYLPDVKFQNKKQYILSPQGTITIADFRNRMRWQFYGGLALNGYLPGFRDLDMNYDKWRTTPVYAGVGIYYVF